MHPRSCCCSSTSAATCAPGSAGRRTPTFSSATTAATPSSRSSPGPGRAQLAPRPGRLRLVNYTVGARTHALATTLLDRQRYAAAARACLDHGRWSLEELCKLSQLLLILEQFHGRSERTVPREVLADGSLIAMTRLCANRSEERFRARSADGGPARHSQPQPQPEARKIWLEAPKSPIAP